MFIWDQRTLDLILVTNPSIINKVHTLPPLGLSDHDVVYIEADIWLRKVRQQPRKIVRLFLNKFHISFTVLFASLFMFIIFSSVSSKSDLMLSQFALSYLRIFLGCWRIDAYYRPPSDKGTSLQQLELSLSRINHASNTNIILGGDFNLGHIDWSILRNQFWVRLLQY
jgi:hypothetical protein